MDALWIRIQIRIEIRIRLFRIRPEVSLGSGYKPGFESGFESWIGIRFRILDSDPDQKLAKTYFFVLKFLPSLIFKHKKAAFRQLRDLDTNKVRKKFAGFGS